MQKENIQNHPIKFYKQGQEYGYFSNFYPSPFTIDNKVYPTNQHYFQSKKFKGEYEEQVVNAKTPNDAFKLGRSRKVSVRQDWQQVKQKIMYEGLKAKFTQNKDLRQKLLQTGDRKLIQHTKNDKYWADGGDGSGKNRLGILLMELRSQLKNQQK